ncbi:amidohydrolase family protein [Parafilimonas sp.]|uniref:amidohydrolase family protein n=1 Tax=Parafilimonas sp. TaxID=1969739 RepID=UPI0039E256ED
MNKLLTAFALLISINVSLAQTRADSLLLINYRPVSIYKTPMANIKKAAFPVIDMHSHDYAGTPEDVDDWVKRMDKFNIEKTMVLCMPGAKGFDSALAKYGRYPKRFALWCCFDYTGYGTPGWQKHAVEELEKCYKKGAKGVGELGDKGDGEIYSAPVKGYGLHIDDVQMKPLLAKCAELHMPVSIHVAEDEWMYEIPDSTNDGLMNAFIWHVDTMKAGRLGHDALIQSLANAARDNPNTIFIACHYANSCSNLQVLGDMLDKYPNLYADIAARYAEIAPVPRYAAAFIIKHQDKLLYGTDNSPEDRMYLNTFRILESADEHFYEPEMLHYHWALYGLNLPAAVLEKLYRKNAEKILNSYK